MVVRFFFGGFDFTPADAHGCMPAEVGYTQGVPMNSDLRTAPAGKSPTFLVAARAPRLATARGAVLRR